MTLPVVIFFLPSFSQQSEPCEYDSIPPDEAQGGDDGDHQVSACSTTTNTTTTTTTTTSSHNQELRLDMRAYDSCYLLLAT